MACGPRGCPRAARWCRSGFDASPGLPTSRPFALRLSRSWLGCAANSVRWPASKTAPAPSPWSWPQSSPPAPGSASRLRRSASRRTMRVLLVTDWVRVRGGVEAYTAWLHAGLTAAGDEVRLLTSTTGSAGDGRADFRAWGTERPAGQAFLQVVNPFAVAQVRRALREFRPDVALVNTFASQLSPAVLRPLRTVPTVLSLHDYKAVCPTGCKLLPGGERCRVRAGLVCWREGCLGLPHWLRDQARYALIRAGLRSVDRIVVGSRWMQEELARNEVPAEHVPLPVPAPGPSFRRSPAAVPTFLFCGRLQPEKGVPLLLRAFARLHRDM